MYVVWRAFQGLNAHKANDLEIFTTYNDHQIIHLFRWYFVWIEELYVELV